jgi:ABC-type branched-subunit amino acid transport system ATPase component
MTSAGPLSSTGPLALAIEDVVAGYGGAPVLDGVSMQVKPASITAVLGANGAGKTTLLRTITGFVKPRRGSITAGGASLVRRSPDAIARAGVAHVPEGQGVITELTVEENLRLGALTRHGRASRAAALADATSGSRSWVSAAAGRGRAVRRRAADLGIARALMAQPKCCCWTSRRWASPPHRRADHGPDPPAARRDRPDRPAGRAERPSALSIADRAWC